ncbi:MAG: sulfurtransferase [Burkholderiales bacterium]|nr:sulfurtransferase [Burkholderiales bacterium]
MNTINIAAYRFVSLVGLTDLRVSLKEKCLALELKGTILLAPEGINLFVAGSAKNVESFIAFLTADRRFAGMVFKKSPSVGPPFKRTLVKIKREIIPLGMPDVSPAEHPAPSVSAETLKQWLDEGRDLALLDVRNEYEVGLGTFNNSLHLALDTFRAFPEEANKLDPSLKNKVVVTFCTGGIRCEKAAPVLLNAGFREVYQLSGGILKYFEEAGGAHYRGDCFVFDRRVALNPMLEESGTVQCYNCLSPVSREEQGSPHYAPDISCPHCISGKPVKKLATLLEQRAYGGG